MGGMNPLNFIPIRSVRGLLLLLAAASAAMLSVALIGQYGFDLHPCHLCIAQRVPYAAIVVLGLVGYVAVKQPRLLHALGWLCVALFFTDAVIAFYHAGVELQWFPGPSGCTNSATANQSLEEMRRAIMEAPLVTCDQAMVQFLGLSMAAWNSMAAFALGIFALTGLRRLQ